MIYGFVKVQFMWLLRLLLIGQSIFFYCTQTGNYCFNSDRRGAYLLDVCIRPTWLCPCFVPNCCLAAIQSWPRANNSLRPCAKVTVILCRVQTSKDWCRVQQIGKRYSIDLNGLVIRWKIGKSYFQKKP